MHGDVSLGGPLSYLLIVLAYASWGLALYVVADGLRRPNADFAVVPEGRWTHVVFQGFYFVAFGLSQIPQATAITRWTGMAMVVLLPLALAAQVAYLLRVTFPSHKRLEARAVATRAALEREIDAAAAAHGSDMAAVDAAATKDEKTDDTGAAADV